MRVGVRALARRPGFTAAAVLTLAIGIGATAAVATVTNALLFQPLPVPDPDALVVVAQLDEHTADFPHGLSWPEYLDYRERNEVFDGLAARSLAQPLLSMNGRAAERVRVEYVSDNYFEVLQMNAGHGRTFLPGEGRGPGSGDAPFIVLTHRAWQTRFGGDPVALGQVVRLGAADMTVIGITPEAFTGASGVVPVELYVLATEVARVEPGWTDLSTNRLPERFLLTGRLRDGVTVAEAAAQLDVLADALAAEHPDASRDSEPYVVAERHARPEPNASRHARPLMSVVMGLATLVLLVAVANVGTLLVGRGAARRQDGTARGSGRDPAAARAAARDRERAAGVDGRRRRRPRRDPGRRSRHGRRCGGHGWAGPVGPRHVRGLAGVRIHGGDRRRGRRPRGSRPGAALDAHRPRARHRLGRPRLRQGRVGAAPDERARRGPGRRVDGAPGLRGPLRAERQERRRDRLRLSDRRSPRAVGRSARPGLRARAGPRSTGTSPPTSPPCPASGPRAGLAAPPWRRGAARGGC